MLCRSCIAGSLVRGVYEFVGGLLGDEGTIPFAQVPEPDPVHVPCSLLLLEVLIWLAALFCGLLERWFQSTSLPRCPLDLRNQVVEAQAGTPKSSPSTFDLRLIPFSFA